MDCPICLDEVDPESKDAMRMPVCHHVVHSVCALRAARHNFRCPLCRTEHPSFAEPEAESAIDELAQLIAEHDIDQERYNERCRQAFRQHRRLRRMAQLTAEARSDLADARKSFDLHWAQLKRAAWKHDPTLNEMRAVKRKRSAQLGYMDRRLKRELRARVGAEPPSLLRRVANLRDDV